MIEACHTARIVGSGQVVRRAPTHAKQFGLMRDGKIMVTVDHGFALSNPALVSAPSKKSTGTSHAVKYGLR